MDIPHHLLNQAIICGCGQTHAVPIRRIVVGDGVLTDAMSFLHASGYQALLLVADHHTRAAFGALAERELANAGFDIHVQTLVGDHLLPDEQAVAAVLSAIAESAPDVVLAVGSGVINDVVRYATFQSGLPYVVLATAASMDGYASSVAAMQFAGVKTTLPARAPVAIFAEARVLAQAPFAMLQSGFGDLVGKVTSLMDWLLSHVLYGEHFCPDCFEIVLEPLRFCVEQVDALAEREASAAAGLFVGLINAGIAMAMLGNSRPCSGSEHHCSHYWDLLAFQGVREHAAHGLQVGYATRWTIRMYRWVVAAVPSIQPPLPLQLTEDWQTHAESFYGDGAAEVLSAQRAKQAWLQEHAARVAGVTMADVVVALQPLLSLLDAVETALTRMRIPVDPSALGLNTERLRQTFLHAKELRARYTIFDFLHGQGLLAAAARDVLQTSVDAYSENGDGP